MTLSMELALEMVNEKKGALSVGDLGFFLTVLRDNARDDDVYELLVKLLNYMEEIKDA